MKSEILAFAVCPFFLVISFQLIPNDKIHSKANFLLKESLVLSTKSIFGTPTFARRNRFPQIFASLSEYETYLADIIFSQTDPTEEIASNIEKYDADFLNWLDSKISASKDLEERAGLGSLKDMIVAVTEKLKQLEFEYNESTSGKIEDAVVIEDSLPVRPKSNSEVFQELRTIQKVSTRDEMAIQQERKNAIQKEIEAGYNAMLLEILNRASTETLTTAVEAVYDRVDLRFMELVKKYIVESTEISKKEQYQSILDEISVIQNKRMGAASERLQKIFNAGSPVAMQNEVARLATAGEVDEPLILLLEANILQAKAAQAGPIVDVLEKVKQRAQMEIDRKVSPSKKLLRVLLRTDDTNARMKILENAFIPRQPLVMTSFDDKKDPEPEVPPPAFISECKTLITQFGNADEDGAVLDRLKNIITEAEETAKKFFGNALSPREQQDRMWNEGTKSIFELEALELQAEMMGDKMPWQNDKYDDMLPPQVKKTGKFDIGGSN